MKVLVTGATGFVGKRVVKELQAGGDQVVVLTRNIAKGAVTLGKDCKYFLWADTSTLPPVEAFDGVDAIINLMGENVAAKKWDENQKKKIYESRVVSTSKLIEAMKGLSRKPKTFVSASAVGVYGDRGEEEITESSAPGNDFLATVCKDWEREASKARDLGMRVVIIRTGIVLGKDGGALKKMLCPFKMGMGGKLGSGKQFMSWIHVNDLAHMYADAVRSPSIDGIFNGTSPYPATNKDFTKQLGKALNRPAFACVPTFAVKAMFGEMGDVMLAGQKVLPTKFKEKKFRFLYPTLEMALKESLR